METTWKKRYYQLGDESKIQDLFRLVFKKEMGKTESKKHWEWEYIKNPGGRGEILLAVDEEQIAGHYAVTPQRMKFHDNRLMATLSLDTMVHPDYRGQKMFTILASRLYEDLGKKGMPITYGFPNENSIHGILSSLNWTEISTMPVLQKTIETEKVVSRAIKAKFVGKIASVFLKSKRLTEMPLSRGDDWIVGKIDTFDEEFDAVFDQGSADIKVITIRDSKYLNWRFIEKPENDYECFCISRAGKKYGYIVLKIEEKFDLTSGFIIDYFSRGNDPKLDMQLISWGTDYLNYRRADIIVVMMFSHLSYFTVFRKLGYFKIPKRFFPKDIYFCARKNNNSIDFNLITDKTSWYLTWADTDVV